MGIFRVILALALGSVQLVQAHSPQVILADHHRDINEPRQHCKCLPGDNCFPSPEQWDAFAKTLTRPLITNQRPIASVCYESSSNFDADKCLSTEKEHSESAFLTRLPNTLQYFNHEALITETEVFQCAFDPSLDGTCHQGRVPHYVITVTAVEDIQNTIRFATEHNLRLVVKNTGHEFIGRSFGVGSVELFTHELQGIQFNDEFTPIGAPEGTKKQEAVTVAAGVVWDELYSAVDKRGRSIAGGWAVGGSVGAAAGWPLGGGHSVLSPHYGLGVDNVLEISVVLPTGDFVVANAYQNTDVFWALRGGGGPSFGVVTELTYRIHPNPPHTGAYYVGTADSPEAFARLMVVWMKYHNPVFEAGWAGVWPYFQNSLYLTFTTPAPTHPGSVANTTLEAFFAESRALPGVEVSLAMTAPYRSYYHFIFDNLIDSSKGFGVNYTSLAASGSHSATTSWLLPKTLTAPENAELMGNVLAKITVGIAFFDLGGVVHDVPADATAVPPAFRHSITDLTSALSWTATATAQEIHAIERRLSEELQPLRDLAPPPYGAQYINEPDIVIDNWAEATWGTNYPRLKELKKQLDPNDLFIVRQGVNTEGWDSELICKTY